MKKKLLFVGLDVHAKNITVALAGGGGGSDGVARLFGAIANDLHALEKVFAKLRKAPIDGARGLWHPGAELRVCYEAGPTGFVLARRLAQLKILASLEAKVWRQAWVIDAQAPTHTHPRAAMSLLRQADDAAVRHPAPRAWSKSRRPPAAVARRQPRPADISQRMNPPAPTPQPRTLQKPPQGGEGGPLYACPAPGGEEAARRAPEQVAGEQPGVQERPRTIRRRPTPAKEDPARIRDERGAKANRKEVQRASGDRR